MIAVAFLPVLMGYTAFWIIVRAVFALINQKISWKREGQLLLVYICLAVALRFTFFPLSGGINPRLFFDPTRVFPPQLNLIPLVNLLDYPSLGELLVNVIGNTAMFIPMGMVWPGVYKELNTPVRAIAAGVGLSLAIELLQLPFADRVSDIDDLLLNSLGYCIGYLLYLYTKQAKKSHQKG